MVDVSNPEYRKVYALLFGVAVRLWEETMTHVVDASIDDIEAELFTDE